MANTLKFGNGEWYGKKDTILAYNDENSNYKPLPFDFSRASKATVVNKDGLIEEVGSGQPRIDYKDDSKGALLLEPSRTNQMTNSEDFTSWTKQGAATISLENISNPVNSTNANLITVDSNGLYANKATPNASSVYAISFWLYKNNNIGNIVLDNAQGGANGQWEINLDLLPNSFVRIDESHPSVNVLYEFKTLSSGDIAPRFKSPEGTKSFYVTGFQLEQGSYPTSYIPTQGSAVTRLADVCSQTVPSGVIGQTEGTIFFESKINGIQAADMRFQLSDGGTSNWIFMSPAEATGIGVKGRAYINSGNVNQFTAYSEYLSEGNHKYALAYKQNDIAFYVDGVQIALDTSATIPSCSKINLSGNVPTNASTQNLLEYNQVKLYNTRLSNSELAALTQV